MADWRLGRRRRRRPSLIFLCLHFISILFIFQHRVHAAPGPTITTNATTITSATQSSTANTTLITTTAPAGAAKYTIGVLFPNPVAVRPGDPTLNDMILASETAIIMAARNISVNHILPDVELNFIRYYSDENNLGQTAWTTVSMLESGVNAIVGDMISDMTETEAGIAGVRSIPQCSCASASRTLSDKDAYPYFFRTVGDVVLFGRSLIDWVSHMGWSMFAIIYTNDNVGQQVLSAMLSRAADHHIHAMTQLPLYDMSKVEDTLEKLEASGARVVIFTDSTTSDQLTVLKTARSMGLLSEGWVWMLTNDMSPAIRDTVDSPEELAEYDGLMFISGLWDLSGIPAYDDMQREWQSQNIPANFTNPDAWYSSGLSYNAPNAYACAELLALGLNKSLDAYPGGRQQGLSDLKAEKFNSSAMTPEFYNLNYTGPAGFMDFLPIGDLSTGYFGLQYMLNGSVVTYATLKNNYFEFLPNTTILYLGHTTQKPDDMVAKSCLNPTFTDSAGIVVLAISSLGFALCLILIGLIAWYRDLKPIMAASPSFCCVQLVGILLAYAGVIMYLDYPSPAKCIARKFAITTGFILVVGSLIAKNYRIYRIFQNVFTVRTSRLKSSYLMRILVIFGAVAYIPLIVWESMFHYEVEDMMVTADTYCWLCFYPDTQPAWRRLNPTEIFVLSWGVLLIIIAALLAFKTRKVQGKWSETNQTAYVSYNIGLAAILASPSFFMTIDNFLIGFYLKISSVLFAATFTLVVLFFPKLTVILQYIYSEHRMKLWRLGERFYRDRSNSRDEFSNNAMTEENSEQMPENLAARNLLDFSVQAHEGMLPVKRVSRFNFMAIWELKHIVVVPLKRFFVLMNQSGQKAQRYHYVACEPVSSSTARCMFRVLTDNDSIFMFQVHDQVALARWIQWFRGPVDHTNEHAAAQNQQYSHSEDDNVIMMHSYYDATEDDNLKFANTKLGAHDPLTTFGAVRSNQAAQTAQTHSTIASLRRPSAITDPTLSTYNTLGDRQPSSSLIDDAIHGSSDLLIRQNRSDHEFSLSPTTRTSFTSMMTDSTRPSHY
ncbi:periplasmic binding protein-like I [Syncephalastrum racemosum]|uniref:Periplasmic binding protein-like I n=1 Tax=Syncephalastrum racemosum TaxID=13706 RepID=A0A1X2HCD9_SYNRA|nr:periplasmic binding protein-like I [Syncephalastrum racemosum]